MKPLRVVAIAVSGLLVLTLLASPASAGGGIWVQQTARGASDACPEGWGQSWAQWPNGNSGGFVCNKYVNDPSANPDSWLFFANAQMQANSTLVVDTPRCVVSDFATGTTPLGARLISPPAGLTISSWNGSLTTIQNGTGAYALVGLEYLCPLGTELIGVV